VVSFPPLADAAFCRLKFKSTSGSSLRGSGPVADRVDQKPVGGHPLRVSTNPSDVHFVVE
jgi:hypothetical protein